ncbi:MAG: hypothetical protein ACOC95_05490 [Planctomycetota bacterium]
MHETTLIETEQEAYPGLRVRRDGDAVVVHIPMRFYRRNGRNMIITDLSRRSRQAKTEGDAEAVPTTQNNAKSANQTLVEAIAYAAPREMTIASAEPYQPKVMFPMFNGAGTPWAATRALSRTQ